MGRCIALDQHNTMARAHMHAGPCLAPTAAGAYGEAFWKLAALDLQLGMQQSSLSDAPAFVSLFLRAVQPRSAAKVLCLEAYSASALQYVLQAHYAPHHNLDVGTCYCLDTPTTAEVAKALPGMLQSVGVPGSQSLCGEASEEAKLAAFTAQSSQHVCGVANSVDVVIGAQHLPSVPCSPILLYLALIFSICISAPFAAVGGRVSPIGSHCDPPGHSFV